MIDFQNKNVLMISYRLKDKPHKEYAIKVFSSLFGSRSFYGWYLSILGSDAEEIISRLLRVISDDHPSRYLRQQLSHFVLHKHGVELLAPKQEKLHFEGAGLTKGPFSASSKLSLETEQKKTWENAFKTLSANLRCVNMVYPSVVIS